MTREDPHEEERREIRSSTAFDIHPAAIWAWARKKYRHWQEKRELRKYLSKRYPKRKLP